MLIHPVTSSNVTAIAWADDTLYIHFHNGRVYAYDDAPKSIVAEMLNAESAGKFFHAHIKNVFICSQLPETDPIAQLFVGASAQIA